MAQQQDSETTQNHTPEEHGAGARLGLFDIGAIWFGAAIAITEMWGGGQASLTSLGLAGGIIAIVIGRIIGNGMMAEMAAIGARTKRATMMLTRPVFGIRGSYIPSLFNLVQLLGWTGWMLFVGYLYMDILAPAVGLPTSDEAPAMTYLWIGVLALLCSFWASGGQKLWHTVQRISSVLLLLLTISMTVIVLREYPQAGIPMMGGNLLQIVGGADFVIAMSVSWLPLVADYSRYAKSESAARHGTFWGYFIGGTWMFAVGLLVALATGETAPDQLVVQTIGSQGLGWAIVASVLVLLSTVTTTFLDIFSTVATAQNIIPAIPQRISNIVIGIIGAVIALTLDVFQFEGFLLAIGAIFLPAFTVVLTHYLLTRKVGIDVDALTKHGGSYWYRAGFNWPALTAWFIGFAVYDVARGFRSLLYFTSKFGINPPTQPWEFGASIPCIVVSATVYALLFLLGRTISNQRHRT